MKNLFKASLLSIFLFASALSQAASLTAYDESLGSGWADWGWSTTTNFSDTSLAPPSGTKSAHIVMASGGAGFSLHYSSTIALATYGQVSFSVYAPDSATATKIGALKIYLENSTQSATSHPISTYASIKVGTWTLVQVPITAISSGISNYTRIDLWDSGATGLTFNMDAMMFGPKYTAAAIDGNGYFNLTSPQSAYIGYKPDTYNPIQAAHLLIWMHGCGGTAAGDMANIAPSATRATQSYIAVSLGGRDGACWDVNSDTPKVTAIITDIAKYFSVNPKKVILGGYSSGGDLTYRVGFQNASLFAALLVENSDPFRDTGATEAALLAAASWKINIVHLAHIQDANYLIADVRASLADLVAASFPVVAIEKNGTHYDADMGTTGTAYDLRTFLMPYMDAGYSAP